MSIIVLYAVVVLLLGISFAKDRKKTRMAVVKALVVIENILPEFLAVVLLVGVLLALIDPTTVAMCIGPESGWLGLFLSLFVGSITLIPGFVAFPVCAMLLEGGAGYLQIGAFVSSLMMVGVITFPVERRFFGAKLSALRNIFALIFSMIVAVLIGLFMGAV